MSSSRVPPHDLVAEASLLGAMLLAARAIDDAIAAGVTASAYYKPAHGHIHDACIELHATAQPVDPITVADVLHRKSLLDVIGGHAALVNIQAGTPAISNASRYAQIVCDHARRRRLIEAAAEIADLGYTMNADVEVAEARALALVTTTTVNTSATVTPLDWVAFFKRDQTDADFIIEPVMPRSRQVAIYAPAKQGKSLFALEVAAAAATGRAVLDQPAGDPVDVVYLDFEMTEDDLWERLVDLGYGPDSDLERFHYYLLPNLPPLDTEAGGVAVAKIVQEHDARLVVIDTMARVVSGDENDADTYRAYFRHTGSKLKRLAVSAMRLDHTGKDVTKGQRGSSAKVDDVDIVWRLESAPGGIVTLTRTHSRVAWVPEKVIMRRLDNPLRHVTTNDAWPAGTLDIANRLDRYDVPLDATIDTAQAALKRHDNKGARKLIVSAALRYRRETVPGTVPSAAVPTTPEPSEQGAA